MSVVSDAQHINLVDGHVHIYECFELSQFLDAAYDNFKEQARSRRGDDNFTGVLLLSERASDNYFQVLTRFSAGDRSIASPSGKQWYVRQTSEPCSLLVGNELGEQLFVIAGRQLVTQERLEVLALITEHGFSDGTPIAALIEEIQRRGAIAVIPWGVGKWMGGRGKVVGSLLTEKNRGKLFLGDNGGRPGLWPSPPLFTKAGHLGIPVIPGSDPLPLETEGERCGSFGFAVRGALSKDCPGRDLKYLLGNDSAIIEPYGELESPGRFIRNQMLLRLASSRVR